MAQRRYPDTHPDTNNNRYQAPFYRRAYFLLTPIPPVRYLGSDASWME